MPQPLRVVVATGNAGKAREFGRLLGPALAVEPLPASVVMPEETGDTFAANARLKAEWVSEVLQGSVSVLADDSGLEVAALGHRPGVLSARYAGEGASDGENVAKLLGELGANSSRDACFVCSLCLVLAQDLAEQAGTDSVEAQGLLCGEITMFPRGEDGFGYDPVFQPSGWRSTLAEASAADKDGVSHRGAASRELLMRLVQLRLTEVRPVGRQGAGRGGD